MTTFYAGMRRLERLAKILDTADAKHKKAGEELYDQKSFSHRYCGTPACALGHWAAHNPKRWTSPEYPKLRKPLQSWTTPFESAGEEFHLSSGQVNTLFDLSGCGRAKTAKQAAAYIRKFVAQARKLRAAK